MRIIIRMGPKHRGAVLGSKGHLYIDIATAYDITVDVLKISHYAWDTIANVSDISVSVQQVPVSL